MSDEERIADLLLKWESRLQQGEDVSAQELCRDCPWLMSALNDAIKSLKRMGWLCQNGSDQDEPTLHSQQNSVKLCAGQVLACRYRLEALIGEGGFGQVWRAFDGELQRAVAIKVPKRLAQPLPDFLDEARKLARLKHPGIVAVHDVARHNGVHFIVSDLIEGQDLWAKVRRNPPSVREAVLIVAEAARRLHYAHQQGLIHRDIKPANILIDEQNQVYLTDFGIAATLEELRLRGNDGCGTLAYMSPEQIHGDASRIDARTDIYSLGVVLYQLLVQQHPFQAENSASLHRCILRQEPRAPRSINPRIPREIERICLKCLSKSPVNRFESAEQLANALTHSLRNRWRTRSVALMLAVTLALVSYNSFGRMHEAVNKVEETPAKEASAGLMLPNKQQDVPKAPEELVAAKNSENNAGITLAAATTKPSFLKMRDIFVGIAYSELTQLERAIADVLIDEGLLCIQDEKLSAARKGSGTIRPAVWNGETSK